MIQNITEIINKTKNNGFKVKSVNEFDNNCMIVMDFFDVPDDKFLESLKQAQDRYSVEKDKKIFDDVFIACPNFDNKLPELSTAIENCDFIFIPASSKQDYINSVCHCANSQLGFSFKSICCV